ncbi:hypothetical protein BN1708_015852, partial [Verticillium longisporum]
RRFLTAFLALETVRVDVFRFYKPRAELLDTWCSPRLPGHIVGNYDADRIAGLQHCKENHHDIMFVSGRHLNVTAMSCAPRSTTAWFIGMYGKKKYNRS